MEPRYYESIRRRAIRDQKDIEELVLIQDRYGADPSGDVEIAALTAAIDARREAVREVIGDRAWDAPSKWPLSYYMVPNGC